MEYTYYFPDMKLFQNINTNLKEKDIQELNVNNAREFVEVNLGHETITIFQVVK